MIVATSIIGVLQEAKKQVNCNVLSEESKFSIHKQILTYTCKKMAYMLPSVALLNRG